MEDFFMVDIPIFVPQYKKSTKYGWSRHKDNLWEVLMKATGGYCMYCYDSVWINGQRRGQIEHGIEKGNSVNFLSDCVPNLGLACENCNGKYKRAGERRRKLPEKMVAEFENNDCRKYDCKEPCEKYKKLRREYVRRGKILVQPFETRVCDTGRTLRIQYDLLKHRYIPSRSYGQYSEEELGIIERHIKQFSLNEPERRNFEIGKYCKNVIDSGSLMRGVEYNNLIVDLFREKLLRLDMEKALKICGVIYGNSFSQMAT